MSERKEPEKILELILRESLQCLGGQRSTMFVVEEKSGILKTEYIFAPEPANEQVSLYEEKEVARKALKQKRPLLLREPEGFGEFFNYDKRERKITSLLSIPLNRVHPVRVQSLALIDESRRFTENDLQFFSIFTNQAAIATEMASLDEEIAGTLHLRRTHDRHLDSIMEQLQSLLRKERERLGRRGGGPALKGRMQDDVSAKREEKPVCAGGPLPLENGSNVSTPEGEGTDPGAWKESNYESLCFGEDFKSGGLFIRTPNPMELGERIFLDLRIPDERDPIALNCKVVWTNKYGKENKHLPRGMGVKLVEVSPEARKRLEKFFYLNDNKELSSEYWRMSIVN